MSLDRTRRDRRSAQAMRSWRGEKAIAPVHRPVLEAALDSGLADFEDAVLHEAALQVSAQAIVTRDPTDFKRAALPVYSPRELNQALELRASDKS